MYDCFGYLEEIGQNTFTLKFPLEFGFDLDQLDSGNWPIMLEEIGKKYL